MSCEYEIFLCDDIETVSSFYRNVWMPVPYQKNPDWLKWLLYGNPHVKRDKSPTILAIKNGVIVGHLTAYPSLMWSKGECTKFAWIHNLFVSPEHRRHKVGTNLMNYAADIFGTVIGSGQSSTTDIIQKKYSWHTISSQFQFETILWSKNLFFGESKIRLYQVVRRFLAMIWGESIRGLPKRKMSIDRLNFFSCGVNNLWDTVKKYDIVLSDRSFDTLMWRFSKHPYYKYEVFEAKDGSGEVAAYVVVRFSGHTCYIVDFLSILDVQYLSSLILEICRVARNDGCIRLIFNGASNIMSHSLVASGFVKTNSGQSFRNHPYSMLNFKNKNVQFTMLDSDIDR